MKKLHDTRENCMILGKSCDIFCLGMGLKEQRNIAPEYDFSTVSFRSTTSNSIMKIF